MQAGKVSISFFLLLIYFFGSAHNLIPHSQEFDSQNHNSATHEHHQHTQDKAGNSDHHHVLHNNHFDEDLFDLLVCFFSETEHAANACEIQHYLPTATIDDSIKELTKAKFVALLFVFVLTEEQSEAISAFEIDLIANYLSPFLDDSPSRGPPTISFTDTKA